MSVRTITVQELEAARQRGEVAEFWNVLTDEYFKGEMIPGSRRVPLERVGREAAERGLAADTVIVVYCSDPTCPQSALAAEKLSARGYQDVRRFEGGLEAWKAAGRAIERLATSAAA